MVKKNIRIKAMKKHTQRLGTQTESSTSTERLHNTIVSFTIWKNKPQRNNNLSSIKKNLKFLLLLILGFFHFQGTQKAETWTKSQTTHTREDEENTDPEHFCCVLIYM